MSKASKYIYVLLIAGVVKAKAQVEPPAYSSAIAVNSVTVYEAKSPETNYIKFLGKVQNLATTTTQYYDGLGRPLQTVIKQGSPLGKDIVSAACYDELGRSVYNFLPFVATQTQGGNEITDDGEFKYNPFQQQKAFYKSQLAAQNETYFYSQLEYESSSLNRVVKSMAAGDSWVKNGVGITTKYELNQSDEKVHIWSIPLNNVFPTTSASDVYGAGKLSKVESIDENQKKVITYTDLSGNMVLKKVQEKDGANVTVEHAGWSCTYFVYDDFNNLRYVITPKAVAYLDNNNWVMTQSIINSLCFKYDFDARRRPVMKKQPGAGEVYLVYDARDRVVLTQDANLNRLINPSITQSKWKFTLYDNYNRVVATGLVNNNTDRVNLQNYVDNLPGDQIVTVSAFTGGNSSQTLEVNCPVAGYTVNDNALFNSNVVFNSITHYDNYNYQGVKAFNSNYTFAPNSTDFTEPTEASNRLFGFVTGEKVRIIDNDNINSNDRFIFSTIYYDDYGRSIQTLTDNIKNGVDYVTRQYDFSGKLLSEHTSHSDGATSITIISKNTYDKDGRLIRLSKNYNNSIDKALAEYTYNELGQLKTKRLAPGYTGSGKQEMETQNFSYNIHGSLTGINKGYVLSNSDFDQWDFYFGMYLGYDNREQHFSNAQYNGNITGAMWRSQGDNAVRKFDYTYDNLKRLSSALFMQKRKPSYGWSNTDMDFSVYATYEDANGNLRSLKHMGVMPGATGIKVIDDLKYYYMDVPNINGLTGNQLKRVDDDQHTMGASNGILNDFKDGGNAAGADDYEYDVNGNLTRDLNKDIQQGGMVYNFLNKPYLITLNNKSTVEYVYDAYGSKLSKKVVKWGASASKTTFYIGGFVYEDSDLKYILHEEGRVKVITPVNNSTVNTTVNINEGAAGFSLPAGKKGVFEYFINDNLGNTRMVLTEEEHKEYFRSYVDAANAATEEPLFGRVIVNSNNTVSIPADNELKRARTNNSQVIIPWTNNATDFVNLSAANGKMIGPNMLLKVMSGDIINATSRYFYHQNNSSSGTTTPVQNAVTSLIFALTGSSVPSIGKTVTSNVASNLEAGGGDFATFITNTQPNTGDPLAPKAYLNIVFLDEQFKFIAGDGITAVGSMAQRVSVSNADAAFSPMSQKAPQNGWAYIYLSNESNEPVYFDDFFVSQEHSRISEESHYYPHGMKISGICARAFNKLPNKYGYQGDFSEEDEESGYNEFYLRTYNAQIGRWNQVDPYDEFAGPYIGMANDPVNAVDPDGGSIWETPVGWGLITATAAASVTGAITKDAGKTVTAFGAGFGAGFGAYYAGDIGNGISSLYYKSEAVAGLIKQILSVAIDKAEPEKKTEYINVIIHHGSEEYDGGAGGEAGGHVMINFGNDNKKDDDVYGFTGWGVKKETDQNNDYVYKEVPIFPSRDPKDPSKWFSEIHGNDHYGDMDKFRKGKMLDDGNEVSAGIITIFKIPVTKEQYDGISSWYKTNLGKSPYPYTQFGMRCASSVYNSLKTNGIIKNNLPLNGVLNAAGPGFLFRYLWAMGYERNIIVNMNGLSAEAQKGFNTYGKKAVRSKLPKAP